MRPLLPYLAAAALVAGPALAQTPAAPPASSPAPSATPSASTQPGVTPPGAVNPSPGSPGYQAPPSSPAPAASTGAAANTAANAGASTVMSGMSVKDSTGALIGEVKAVKNGEATIQMGSDTFTVDTGKLGVTNGVASINATQAELKKMLPPKK